MSNTEFVFDFEVINSAAYRRAFLSATKKETGAGIELTSQGEPLSLPLHQTPDAARSSTGPNQGQRLQRTFDNNLHQSKDIFVEQNLSVAQTGQSSTPTVAVELLMLPDLPPMNNHSEILSSSLSSILYSLRSSLVSRKSTLISQLDALGHFDAFDLIQGADFWAPPRADTGTNRVDDETSEDSDDDDFDLDTNMVERLSLKAASLASNAEFAKAALIYEAVLDYANYSAEAKKAKMTRSHILLRLAVVYTRLLRVEDFDRTLELFSTSNAKLVNDLRVGYIASLIDSACKCEDQTKAIYTFQAARNYTNKVKEPLDGILSAESISLHLAFCYLNQGNITEIETVLQSGLPYTCYERTCLIAIVRLYQDKMEDAELLLRTSMKLRRKVLKKEQQHALAQSIYADSHIQTCIQLLAWIYKSRGKDDIAHGYLDLIQSHQSSLPFGPVPQIRQEVQLEETGACHEALCVTSSYRRGGTAHSVAFPPNDSSIFALGTSGGMIRLCRTECSAEYQLFSIAKYEGYCIAFSPDGEQLAVPLSSSVVQFYKVTKETLMIKESYQLKTGQGDVAALAISPDGTQVAISSTNCEIMVYDILNGTDRIIKRICYSRSGVVDLLTFSADGKKLANGTRYGIIRILALDDTFHHRELMKIHNGPVSALSFLENGNLLSASLDGHMREWIMLGDVDQGGSHAYVQYEHSKLLLDTSQPLDEGLFEGFSPSGRFIAYMTPSGSFTVFDLRTRTKCSILKRENVATEEAGPTTSDRRLSATFSPDEKFLVLGIDDGGFEVWDIFPL